MMMMMMMTTITKSISIAFIVGSPGKYACWFHSRKKVKFVINILIKLSHTKNRLIIKSASFLLQVYVNFFFDLRLFAQFENKTQLLYFILTFPYHELAKLRCLTGKFVPVGSGTC